MEMRNPSMLDLLRVRRLGRHDVRWIARQLLPLEYRTRYTDQDGNRHFVVWRMWWGRCFSIDDVVLKES